MHQDMAAAYSLVQCPLKLCLTYEMMYKQQIQLGLASVLCMLISCVFISIGWVCCCFFFSLMNLRVPDALFSWLVFGIQFILHCFIFFPVSTFGHCRVFVVK